MSNGFRETWLYMATEMLRPHFEAAGFTIPKNVRVSCGLPSVRAFTNSKRRVGEAWTSEASKDEHFEIFVSPTQDDSFAVLSILVHELVHVTVGLKAGHRGKFIECAGKVGLVGPWTSTTASDELAQMLKDTIKAIGEYPHGSLEGMTNNRKKDKARLVKTYCPHCGYTARITMKWLLMGVPHCGDPMCEGHREAMQVDLPDDDKELIEENQNALDS